MKCRKEEGPLMKVSKISLLISSITTAVILSVVGSLTGTLAWYAYATRATLSFSGTSAHASEIVRIGIHDYNNYLFRDSEAVTEFADDNSLELDSTRKIVWGKEGEGLTGDIISHYLKASPYAVNKLSPVSTLRREIDDPITVEDTNTHEVTTMLYRTPFATDPANHLAPKNYYIVIPLCFKIVGSEGTTLSNHDIWLTGVSALDVTEPPGLRNAFRIYVENQYAIEHHDDAEPDANVSYPYFLINPTAAHYDATTHAPITGETIVAGTLDLKGDGTYDFDFNTKKEVVYGDFDEDTLAYETERYVIPENPETNYNLDDVNNTGKNVASTFLAKHAENVFVAKLNDMTLYSAKYDTLETIAPLENSSGYYYGGKPVAHTDATDDNIAYCELTIFLEGWDHAIINDVINAQFNLGLQFEVNRL